MECALCWNVPILSWLCGAPEHHTPRVSSPRQRLHAQNCHLDHSSGHAQDPIGRIPVCIIFSMFVMSLYNYCFSARHKTRKRRVWLCIHTSLASHPGSACKTKVCTYSVDVVWWLVFQGCWSLVRGRRLVVSSWGGVKTAGPADKWNKLTNNDNFQ